MLRQVGAKLCRTPALQDQVWWPLHYSLSEDRQLCFSSSLRCLMSLLCAGRRRTLRRCALNLHTPRASGRTEQASDVPGERRRVWRWMSSLQRSEVRVWIMSSESSQKHDLNFKTCFMIFTQKNGIKTWHNVKMLHKNDHYLLIFHTSFWTVRISSAHQAKIFHNITAFAVFIYSKSSNIEKYFYYLK